MGGFCPDDWHGTTEEDLQQMSWGEDYWMYADGPHRLGRLPRSNAELREANRLPYAIHDEAIAQAKLDGVTFHLLPDAEQSARLDAAEAIVAKRAKDSA